MKKQVQKIFLIIILFYSCQLSTKKQISFNPEKSMVLAINFNCRDGEEIIIYDENKKPYLTIILSTNDSENDKLIFISDTLLFSDYERYKEPIISKNNFNPLCFFPEYNISYFEANKINDNGELKYLIKLSEIKLGYISLNRNINIENWSDFLLNKSINGDEMEVFDKPTEVSKSKNVNLKELDYNYTIIKVENDWVQVKCNDECGGNCPNFNAIGWVRWRKDGKIIVNLGYIC